MRNVYVILMVLSIISGSYALDVQGNQNGTWSLADSPIRVVGEVTVVDGETLTIDPGVVVNFADSVRILINGTLIAQGTEQDSIIFKQETPGYRHYSLDFINTQTISYLEYCVVRDGLADGTGGFGTASSHGAGIFIQSSSPEIRNCEIYNNRGNLGGGIFVINMCSPLIEKNVIRNNTVDWLGGGIGTNGFCTPDIRNNIFYGNNSIGSTFGGGGISFYSGVTATLTNNLFYGNSAAGEGGALIVYNANNTITIRNSIFRNNSSTAGSNDIFAGDYADDLTLEYSNFAGGDTLATNFEIDPLFNDAANYDFHFEANSPMVDAGTNTGAPADDFDGNLRPFDGDRDLTSTTDIGPYEYQNTTPQITSTPVESVLEDNAYLYQVQVTDPDWDETLAFSLLPGAPSFLNIDPGTGLITANPGNDDIGTYPVTVQVSDRNNATDTQPFDLTVVSVNDPPIVGNIPGETIQEGGTFLPISLDNYVSDEDNPDATIQWNYSGNIDLLVNINPVTRIAVISTQNTNWFGTETITFTAIDTGLLSASDTAVFTVNPVNDAPIIAGQPGAVTTPEETELTIDFGDITVTDVDNNYPQDFMLTVMDGQNYTRSGNAITPVVDFNGNLTVPVYVNDGTDDSNIFDMTVNVTAVNDIPQIIGQSPLSTPEDTELTITLSDLTVTDTDNTWPADFTLSVESGTNYFRVGNAITPDADFNGDLTVPVVVNDGLDNSDSFDLTVSVTPVNDAPVITAQSPLSTPEETALTITLADLTVTDPDNTYPADFILSVQDGQDYTRSGNIITPVANFNGNLTVPVLVNDGTVNSAVFDLMVSVTAVNDLPEITGQSPISTPEETAITIVLSDLTVSDDDNTYPDDFTLSVQDGQNYTRSGNMITPDGDFNGDLTVPVIVNDGLNNSNIFDATVNVTPINDAPEITGQSPVTTPEETGITIALSDLVVEDVDNTYPADFSLTVQDGQNYTRSGNTITPGLDFNGNLTVPVLVNDGALNSEVFDITVSVSPVNDAPVITGQEELITPEETDFTVLLTHIFVSDPDNTYPDDFSLSVQDGANYSRSGNTITPDTDFNGDLTVPVLVNDGSDNSAEYDLLVSVTAVSDIPLITGQVPLSTPEEAALEITLAHLTVSDVDNTYPDDFTLTGQDGNDYTRSGNIITPVVNFNGNLSVPVTVNDGTNNSNTFNLTLSVTPVNDAPAITGQSPLSTPEETALTIALANLIVTDVDNTYPDDFSLSVQDGNNYTRENNTITPVSEFSGDLTVPVLVNDGFVNSAIFDISVSVSSVNDVPVITGQSALSTPEETAMSITLTDLVVSDDDNTYPEDFTLTVQNGQNYTRSGSLIRPVADFNGDLTVPVFVNDGTSNSVAFDLIVSVTPVNDIPVITDQSTLTTPEETALTITLGDLTVTDVDDTYPDDFTLTVQDGDDYSRTNNTITPVKEFSGVLTVPALVSDGSDNSDVFNLTVDVSSVNDVPAITGQMSLSTPEEAVLTITLADLVVTDDDNTYPEDFTLSVESNTNYTRVGNAITPVADFNGVLTVPVIVNDGNSNSNIFNLSVNVTAVNDLPVITDQSVLSTPEDVALVITLAHLTVTDVDNTYPDDFILIVQDGDNYTRTNNTITPASEFSGNLTVPVHVNDGTDNSEVFDLLVNIDAVNDPPQFTSNPDNISFNEDDSLVFMFADIYGWVEDPDNSDNELILTVQGGQYLVADIDSPQVVIKANPDWYGKDTIVIVVSDGELQDTAQVVVDIKPINDAPMFVQVPDSLEFNNTTHFVIEVGEWIEDMDLPGDSLRWEFSVDEDSVNYEFDPALTRLTLTAPGYIGFVLLKITVTDDSSVSGSDSVVIEVLEDPTSVDQLTNNIPRKHFLDQNYPNPFNPITNIKFGLPRAGEVTIDIYNILGQKVQTLWNGHKQAGTFVIDFDASHLASGIYFYSMQAENYHQIKKMILIK